MDIDEGIVPGTPMGTGLVGGSFKPYRKFGAFTSSEDGQKLADTVKGAIKLVGGLVAYFGYSAITGDVNTIADQVGSAVTLGVSFYGAVMTLYGLIKKVVVKVSSK